MRSSPFRHSHLPGIATGKDPVRLACLIHAVSVRSEPESNSQKSKIFEPKSSDVVFGFLSDTSYLDRVPSESKGRVSYSAFKEQPPLARSAKLPFRGEVLNDTLFRFSCQPEIETFFQFPSAALGCLAAALFGENGVEDYSFQILVSTGNRNFFRSSRAARLALRLALFRKSSRNVPNRLRRVNRFLKLFSFFMSNARNPLVLLGFRALCDFLSPGLERLWEGLQGPSEYAEACSYAHPVVGRGHTGIGRLPQSSKGFAPVQHARSAMHHKVEIPNVYWEITARRMLDT